MIGHEFRSDKHPVDRIKELEADVEYLEKCVRSHDNDKRSAQESFGKCFSENQKLHKEVAELRRDAERYNELLLAVERKFPDETRHQTALRYIKSAEATCYADSKPRRMARMVNGLMQKSSDSALNSHRFKTMLG